MRCSTVSTSSVRSSRATRRRKAARSQGQWTTAWMVNSSTLMPCGPLVAARCPPAQAPARAHPTGSTNKGGSRHGVTGGPGQQQKRVLRAGMFVDCPSPHPGRSRPGCRRGHRTGFLPRTAGPALFSSICPNQASLQGEKMGLQSSSSPPLKPYLSNLTQAKGRTEVIGPSSMQKRKARSRGEGPRP